MLRALWDQKKIVGSLCSQNQMEAHQTVPSQAQ